MENFIADRSTVHLIVESWLTRLTNSDGYSPYNATKKQLRIAHGRWSVACYLAYLKLRAQAERDRARSPKSEAYSLPSVQDFILGASPERGRIYDMYDLCTSEAWEEFLTFVTCVRLGLKSMATDVETVLEYACTEDVFAEPQDIFLSDTRVQDALLYINARLRDAEVDKHACDSHTWMSQTWGRITADSFTDEAASSCDLIANDATPEVLLKYSSSIGKKALGLFLKVTQLCSARLSTLRRHDPTIQRDVCPYTVLEEVFLCLLDESDGLDTDENKYLDVDELAEKIVNTRIFPQEEDASATQTDGDAENDEQEEADEASTEKGSGDACFGCESYRIVHGVDVQVSEPHNVTIDRRNNAELSTTIETEKHTVVITVMINDR